jgi:hypothetical protein
MAAGDNTTLNTGTGGDVIATDDLTSLNGTTLTAGTVKAQRVKIGFGSDGTFRDVDATNGLPVIGTFFQTTQPVSIASMPTTAVTGTFWQATQPVSIAAMPNTPVTPPAITKGTQGTVGFTTQHLKDAGRQNWTAYAEAVAGAAAETAIAINVSLAFGAAAIPTGNAYIVPAGKTLRITSMSISWVSTTTTANTTRIRIRALPTGTAVLTSPIVWSNRLGWESPTFIANEAEFQNVPFPGELEFPAGSSLIFSHTEAAANGTVDITVSGYLF